MSQENVEVVRRMFERWNAGDGAGWLRSLHADAEWISEPFAASMMCLRERPVSFFPRGPVGQ